MFPVDGLEDGVLHGGHVLALVHEDVVIFLLQGFPVRRLPQHGHGHLLQVREVQVAHGLLALAEAQMHPLHQRCQSAQMLLNHAELPVQLVLIQPEGCGAVLHHVLDFIPQGLVLLLPQLLPVGETTARRGPHHAEGGQGFPQGGWLPVGGFRQRAAGMGVLLPGDAQLIHRVRQIEHAGLAVQQHLHALQLSPGLLHQHLIPGVPRPVLRLHLLHLLIQPVEGLGQGHEKIVQLPGHVMDVPLAEGCREGLEVRVVLLLQQFVHGIAEGLFEQRLGLLGFRHPAERVNAHGLEVVPQHLLAEGVDGGDLRAFQIVQGLTHHVGVGVQLLQQPLIQPLAHFRRRRPGEGDDEHPVQSEALLQQGDDALHQHGGFSGARGGADQNRMISGPDGLLLLLCPPGCHGDPSFHGHCITDCPPGKVFHVKHPPCGCRVCSILILLLYYALCISLLCNGFAPSMPMKTEIISVFDRIFDTLSELPLLLLGQKNGAMSAMTAGNIALR